MRLQDRGVRLGGAGAGQHSGPGRLLASPVVSQLCTQLGDCPRGQEETKWNNTEYLTAKATFCLLTYRGIISCSLT